MSRRPSVDQARSVMRARCTDASIARGMALCKLQVCSVTQLGWSTAACALTHLLLP